MSCEEFSLKPSVFPGDADVRLLRILWSRLSGLVWHFRARAGHEDASHDVPPEHVTLRMSRTEVEALLSLIRDRARTNQQLVAMFEPELEVVG